jgi:hypothetical protein
MNSTDAMFKKRMFFFPIWLFLTFFGTKWWYFTIYFKPTELRKSKAALTQPKVVSVRQSSTALSSHCMWHHFDSYFFLNCSIFSNIHLNFWIVSIYSHYIFEREAGSDRNEYGRHSAWDIHRLYAMYFFFLHISCHLALFSNLNFWIVAILFSDVIPYKARSECLVIKYLKQFFIFFRVFFNMFIPLFMYIKRLC